MNTKELTAAWPRYRLPEPQDDLDWNPSLGKVVLLVFNRGVAIDPGVCGLGRELAFWERKWRAMPVRHVLSGGLTAIEISGQQHPPH